MIIRLIWWSLKIISICIIVAFIANQEGNSQIVWVGWKMDIPTSILFGSFLLLIIIILWLHNLWKLIINLPTNISKLVKENRQKTGYNALAYGLAASSAGDIESTQKYAAQAQRLLDNKDLTEMLSAHAAHLSGDKNAAFKYFNNLANRSSTKFHGQLGLMRLAIENNDHDEALIRARAANSIQPRNPKLNSLLVMMEAKKEHFEEAIEVLQKGRRIGSIEEEKAQNLAAALHTKIGMKKLEENQLSEAAVISLSKIFIGKDNQRKALSLLSKVWKIKPHPEIAQTLKLIWKNERASVNIANLINLTEDNANSQARLIIADEAISAGLKGEANDQLSKISTEQHNKTYHQLMSRLADQSNDKTKSNQELEKALEANPSQAWVCSSCGFSYDFWSINCSNCDNIGSIAWS